MSPIILNLRHYNTPVVEGIVQPSSNAGYQLDRLPYHKYHHRNGYRLEDYPESSPGHRGCRHHNRCSHVRWSQGLTSVQPRIADQGGGSGSNIPGASFPMWSTV